MNIQPIGDRVVIQQDKAEERTKSGLYIPETSQEKPNIGTIIAIGYGIISNGALIPLSLNVGDRVIFPKHIGQEITIENIDYLILRQSDIFVVI